MMANMSPNIAAFIDPNKQGSRVPNAAVNSHIEDHDFKPDYAYEQSEQSDDDKSINSELSESEDEVEESDEASESEPESEAEDSDDSGAEESDSSTRLRNNQDNLRPIS
jgi:hypothetical protein